ncbi:GGDEF domain-containing protein [Vibrio mimicus]|uniref:diguanylate cyclase VdcA n=1 Tax=Vibrio mimicus TaxID=674 RepID=UPI00076B4422|nr:GGDEF domain-containing protein [Vibrio mimicus]
MTTEDFKKSTANLKKAVPLMMKHHVAATPANYALWYTYVDQANPQLNTEMDAVLANFGLCPPASGEHLYQQYIATKAETNINQLRANVEVLLGEISSSMSDTLSDTSSFASIIDKGFRELERVEQENLSIEEVMTVIRRLVSDSKDIRHSTNFLNNQLNVATHEISRLKEQLAQVQKDALFDSLSGLYNRRAFDGDMFTLLHTDHSVCLIMLDIDHFKVLNDTYGHLFGDQIIRAIAKRLQSLCRDGITAYRYGGEEFALITSNKSLRIARQFAESVRRSIEKLTVKDRRSGQSVGNITASFGVVEKIDGDSLESLVGRADGLLYEAKNLGRNRVMPL